MYKDFPEAITPGGGGVLRFGSDGGVPLKHKCSPYIYPVFTYPMQNVSPYIFFFWGEDFKLKR